MLPLHCAHTVPSSVWQGLRAGGIWVTQNLTSQSQPLAGEQAGQVRKTGEIKLRRHFGSILRALVKVYGGRGMGFWFKAQFETHVSAHNRNSVSYLFKSPFHISHVRCHHHGAEVREFCSLE